MTPARPSAIAWLGRRLAVLLVLLPLAAAAHRARPNVTGVYDSNYGEVRLSQRGTSVTGTYVCCGGGKIIGRIVDGQRLVYAWWEAGEYGDPSRSGHGEWTIRGDRLEGTWGFGEDRANGGRWDLARASAAAEIAQ